MSESFTAPGAQKKQLLVVGTVFGVLALAAALCLMLLGGGNSSAAGSILAANAAAKSSASASPSGLGAYVIPSQYAGTIGHDPFKPVVVAKTSAAGGGSSGASGSTTSTSTSSSSSPTKAPVVTLTPTPSPTVILPTVTPTATPTATVTVTPSPTGLPTSSTSQTLTLVSVNSAANTVNVTVLANGTTTPYTVQNGKVFGTYFKLVSILTDSTTSPPSYGADFQYGDQFIQLNMGQSAQLG
jgi:hypothetical protein